MENIYLFPIVSSRMEFKAYIPRAVLPWVEKVLPKNFSFSLPVILPDDTSDDEEGIELVKPKNYSLILYAVPYRKLWERKEVKRARLLAEV